MGRPRCRVVHVSALVFAVFVCCSRTPATQQLNEKPGYLEAAISEIEAGRATTPLVSERGRSGEVTVTFLAKRDGDREPRIVSDVTGWGERADGTFDSNIGRMTRVGSTEWYSLQAEVAPRARIEYLVAYGIAEYRPDPYNPRRAAREGVASEFVTSGYVAPKEIANSLPAGVITDAVLRSRLLDASCPLAIYTPPNYPTRESYGSAVFLDVGSKHVSRVIDWLIAQESIEPIVAVFVDSHCGREEGRPLDATGKFLVGELPAWLASRYVVGTSAGRRAIIGISYGAKDALDAALAPEGEFGLLGLLIPGRRMGREDLQAIGRRPYRRLRVAILAGRYDQANVAIARAAHEALAAAGHVVDYTEVPEGHNSLTWLNHMHGLLVSLFGHGR